MLKSTRIFAISLTAAALLTLGLSSVAMAMDSFEARDPFAIRPCPSFNHTDRVIQCAKIVFSPTRQIRCPANVIDPTPRNSVNDWLYNTDDVLDIKVLDNPRQVADIRAKIERFMRHNLGCTETSRAMENEEENGGWSNVGREDFHVISVEYAIVPPASTVR